MELQKEENKKTADCSSAENAIVVERSKTVSSASKCDRQLVRASCRAFWLQGATELGALAEGGREISME